MELEEVFERLARFGTTMRACLSALDGAAPEDPLVGRAFDELGERFADLGDLESLYREATGEQAARLDAAIEELTRLNAVLTATVAQDKERLLELLQRARTARRSCRSLRGLDRTGVSCDMHG